MSGSAPFTPVDVELHDGRRVRLREIRPDDREKMRQAFDRLSPGAGAGVSWQPAP